MDPILVVGAPRSGTTWLAKLIDSHPDIVYRHEPDELLHAPENADDETLRAFVGMWAADRTLRTATKRPFFAKSWRSPLAQPIWVAWAYAAMAVGRVPGMSERMRRWTIPDMGDPHRARVLIKTVRLCDGVGGVARAIPGARVFVIIRRPCGQVHSVMRGNREGRFELRETGDMPLDQRRAMDRAALSGVDAAAFAALPAAAQYAWGWVAFNERAAEWAIRLPNVEVVVYDELASAPVERARRIMAFAGLEWHPSVEAFARSSTERDSVAGHYDVEQNAAIAAHRWRSEMDDEDRRIVQAVARQSPLARYWPDLVDAEARA